MIAPIGADSFREALRWGAEVYHSLKSVLKSKGLATGLGDEGGFAPDLPGTRAALDLIARGHREGRLRRWAATSRWRWTWPPPSSSPTASTPTRAASSRPPSSRAVYAELVDAYPLVSIEDPLAEDDWDGWVALTTRSATRSRSSATTCSSPTRSGSTRASPAAPPTRCW